MIKCEQGHLQMEGTTFDLLAEFHQIYAGIFDMDSKVALAVEASQVDDLMKAMLDMSDEERALIKTLTRICKTFECIRKEKHTKDE